MWYQVCHLPIEEAEELVMQTMKSNLRTLSHGHSETVASMINLAEIFYTQGW
jgi:hypothetical protein